MGLALGVQARERSKSKLAGRTPTAAEQTRLRLHTLAFLNERMLHINNFAPHHKLSTIFM
jgi:hypothetical protein